MTPSLPNRFLALVPAGRAADIAREIQIVIQNAHEDIAKAVWQLAFEKLADRIEPHKARFFAQSSRFLDLSWQTLIWPRLPADALALTAHLPKPKDGDFQAGLKAILALASGMLRVHRDVRNFECERFPVGKDDANGRDIEGWKDKSKLRDDAALDNPGAAWSALYALLNWQLDAVRQTRAWKAWNSGGWSAGLEHNKDSLNGREEAVLHLASEEITDEKVESLNEKFKVRHLFKKGEILGASTLIKRLWPTAWLLDKEIHGNGRNEPLFQPCDFSMPDSRSIAAGKPFERTEEERDVDKIPDEEGSSPKYFAVLAFDGDEMGKWVSGTHAKMPKLGGQLADYWEQGQRKGARVYFEQNPALKPLLDNPRPLNPSFHLQLSEMLGIFSNICARRIVEAFDGRLIYSGGDDVLALVPADRALACARALRAAVRGEKSLNAVRGAWMVAKERRFEKKDDALPLFEITSEGFIQLHKDNYLVMAGEPKGFPAIVPGPAADCSVGIAIAHFKSPLQDVVQAAQTAEKRAKTQLGRSAVAVTLFKRSGEIIEWGAKWDGGFELYRTLAAALEANHLSAKFPHRFAELLEAYVTETTPLVRQEKSMLPVEDFPVDGIISRELDHCLYRQRGPAFPKAPEEARAIIQRMTAGLEAYFKSLDRTGVVEAEKRLRSLIGLCQTVAFAHRTSGDNDSN